MKCGTREAGRRLDAVLAISFPALSRTRFQQLTAQKQVTVNGRTAVKRHILAAGDEVEVRLPPPAKLAAPAAENIPLSILYQDGDLIVLDKPPGLVVHPAPGHPGGTLVNALLHHCGDLTGIGGEIRPGIVHRLDKDTSGVMMVAKNQTAFQALGHQFRKRSVEKEYLAIVRPVPVVAAGRIETALARHPRDRQKFAVTTRGGRAALTFYEVLELLGKACLLRVRIETGRTHQIRVHLAWRGHPVLGDKRYGGATRLADGTAVPRQMLHARRLCFRHPADGREMRIEAPLPADMLAVASALRRQADAMPS